MIIDKQRCLVLLKEKFPPTWRKSLAARVGEKPKQPTGGQQYSYISWINGDVGHARHGIMQDIPITPFLPPSHRAYTPPLPPHLYQLFLLLDEETFARLTSTQQLIFLPKGFIFKQKFLLLSCEVKSFPFIIINTFGVNKLN